MEKNNLVPIEPRAAVRIPNLAEFKAIGYQWRKRMMAVFLVSLLGGILSAYHYRDYESEMKILFKKERLEPSPSARSGSESGQGPSEEELNTEVELLRSEDVLRSAVRQLRLQEKTKEPLWVRLFGAHTGNGEEIRTDKAIRVLSAGLAVILPKKSNIMTVRYRSGDPRLAATVLTAVSRFYVEKHMAVDRPPEQFRFFAKQAEQYRAKLADAEERLAEFPRTAGTAASQMELELTENRLSSLKLEYNQTQAAFEEIQKRIASLQAQLASASPRVTTVVRKADNGYLMMQLKTTLLNLELKRTELLKKFEPSYREVQEADREIAQTSAAIEKAEKTPMRDETTDRDPTYEWIRSELAKARADLNSQQAKAASMERSILQHKTEARQLNEKSLKQQDLLREAKTFEETYQLYVRKREEARINDALDQNKILNIEIVQAPTTPALPRRSPWTFVLAGAILAVVLSAGTGLVSEHLHHSFRMSAELERYLGLPVLAVLPPGEPE